jgi:hypothetical protein
MAADKMSDERWPSDRPVRSRTVRSSNPHLPLVSIQVSSRLASASIAARFGPDGSDAGGDGGGGESSRRGARSVIGLFLLRELARGTDAVDRQAGALDGGGEPGQPRQDESCRRGPGHDRQERGDDRTDLLWLRSPDGPGSIERDPEGEGRRHRGEADDRLGRGDEPLGRPCHPAGVALEIGAELLGEAVLGLAVAEALRRLLRIPERLYEERGRNLWRPRPGTKGLPASGPPAGGGVTAGSALGVGGAPPARFMSRPVLGSLGSSAQSFVARALRASLLTVDPFGFVIGAPSWPARCRAS